MKFFLKLDDARPAGEVTSRRFYSYVHGPYQTEIEAREAMRAQAPNDKSARFFLFDGIVCGVPASPKEKPENEKRPPGDEKNWIRTVPAEGLRWVCRECGEVIMQARVAHPIHSRSMPGAGSGRCSYEDIGYCPNCETKPNCYGSPILGEP